MRTNLFDFQAYVRLHEDPEARSRAMSFGEYAYRGDVKALRSLHALPPVRVMAAASLQLWSGWGRRSILDGASKASEKDGARIWAAAQHAARVLQVPAVQVYLVHRLEDVSAQALGDHDEVFVAVHRELAAMLGDDALRFELGRQLGHVQNAHVVYRTIAYYSEQMANVAVRWAAKPSILAINHWRRRATISADRAGLLCCAKLDVATRRIVEQSIAQRRLDEDIDAEAVMAELEQSPGKPLGFVERLVAHRPPLHQRLAALRAFAQSQFFFDQLGLRQTGKSLSTVDDEIDALLEA